MVFKRLAAKLALRRARSGYFSRFGGLWTDRLDAQASLARKLAQLRATADEAALLSRWMQDGYVILPQAVPHDVIDRVRADVESVWRTSDPRLAIEIGGVKSAVESSKRGRHTKLLDLYVYSEAVRDAAFAPPIRRFLSLVFERDPLLFQSLCFDKGSEQPIHQDTAYVVTSSPMEFAASWIALEDIQKGSGELMYYRGSHRLPEFLFKSGTRNWNRERDGDLLNAQFLASLHDKARALGLVRETFLPKKGDALIWNADLAHGGSPIADDSLTRRSLVCHYCPRGVEPYYFAYQPKQRTIRAHGSGAAYASSNYAVSPR